MGEGKLLLEQIQQISKDLLENLMEIDQELITLKDQINRNDEIDKKILLETIEGLRKKIGVLEREDTEEMEDEEILGNMIKKLNSIIDMTI
ncbi:MAG TPA: hypothetical protein VI564_01695 [Candidatus Nanoarchaeia archaeon]|nr:hypothetical protein [Candidatus Nanoarchaeia archaeon]